MDIRGLFKRNRAFDNEKEERITNIYFRDRDLINSESLHEFSKELDIDGYRIKHRKEVKAISDNFVPLQGQADCVQGELLRQIILLRNEANENGNANWDEGYAWFCQFIRDTLINSQLFEASKEKRIEYIMTYIQKCGEYAFSFSNGEIPVDEVDVFYLAYINDDIYNYICDAIAEFYMKNKKPIMHEKNCNINR